MTSGWLIYNREDYEKNRSFADRFLTDCGKYGLGIELKFKEDICILLTGNVISASPNNGAKPSFVINRTRDWLLGKCFEQAGLKVFNTAEASRVCNNKMESHLLASRVGMPQVDMAFCANTPDGVICHGLGYPVVVKSPYGHGGGEVYLAHAEKEVLAYSSRMNCDRALIQRLCPRPGIDIRVYVLGGRVLAAVKRSSATDFRANLSLGGSIEPYLLNEQERGMVERILDALPLDYAGIDFILDKDGGLLFNEMEDVVGSRALYMLGGPDIAGLYMEHISRVLQSESF